MYPELVIRIWMSSKRNALMIIGTLMALETCLILGQVSLNSLFWKKNLQTDMCRPGDDERENSLHPGQIIYGQNSGRKWERMPSWRRSKSGLMKSSILTTHENCDGSISSALRTRKLRRPSRMLARNWKHQWLQLCPSKLLRTIRIVGVVDPMKSKQNLRVFWKPVNLQDCVWENLYRIIMKTILQEKETIHYSITTWFTNLCLCLKPWKFPQQRQQWTRNGENWRKFRRGTWWMSEVRKRWSMKQGRRAQKFISPHWWTSVIWRMLNWRKNTKNTKVELLRGDIVKDDSGSYAVFTEQGSSASQMTAAKVMDIISRLPRCAGQAADAISAYTQVKIEDPPKLLKIPKSECPDIWIRLPRHKWA